MPLQRSPPTTPQPQGDMELNEKSDELKIANSDTLDTASTPFDQHNIAYRNRMKRKHEDSLNMEMGMNAFMSEMRNLFEVQNNKIQLLQESLNTNSAKHKEVIEDMHAIISEIKSQNILLQKSTDSIEKCVDNLSTKLDDVSIKVSTLEENCSANDKQISLIESKIEELDRQASLTLLEIRNVPTKPKENLDDLLKIAIDTAKTANVEISNKDIKDIRRLPGKPEANKPIVVNLNSAIDKKNLIKGIKAFNSSNKNDKFNSTHLGLEGPSKAVYVGEHLTAKAKRLFYLSREYAKSKDYKYCWTSSGRVFLRKDDNAPYILIANEKQLEDINNLAPNSK